MAQSLNKVMLIGRLGGDPELRYTPQGTAVTRFSLATNDAWKDKQTGEMKEKTIWHKIVVWGKVAETVSEYLSKGKQVFVEGRIDNRSWEGEDGQKKYISEIVAQRVLFLGSKGETSPEMPGEEDLSTDGISDDDIPF
jgi:single-strand DNA-binding protein